MWRPLALALVCVTAASCVNYTLVGAGKRTDVGGYSVEPQIAWNKADNLGVQLWTVDGPLLQALRFSPAIKDGGALFKLPAGQPGPELPVYRKNLQLSEIVEFIVDSMSSVGAGRVETHNVRPASFGTADGVRFEFSYLSAQGLESEGIAAAAVIEERLYVIIYTGAKAHYFPKHKDEVERIIGSITI
jgi:predicted small secreted protein